MGDRAQGGDREGAALSPAAEVVPRKPATRAKLTSAQVQEARTRHARGESFAALGRAFDVSGSTIRNAVIGKTWKDVPVAYRRTTTP